MTRYVLFGRRIVLMVLLPLVVAACGPVKPTEHYLELDARPGALTPYALGKVVVKYSSSEVRGAANGLPQFLLPSIESELAAANIFGSDLSKAYELTVTVEHATQGKGFFQGLLRLPTRLLQIPGKYEISVRYELKDGENRVVFNRVLESKSSIYRWKADDAQRVNAKAVGEDTAAKFVQGLSRRLKGRQAEVVAVAPRALAMPEEKGAAKLGPAKSGAMKSERSGFGNYHALIIGNDRYQNLPALESAGFDARQLGAILKSSYGFQTKLLLDATREQIVSSLNDYRKRLSGNDNLLIYYAGHGWVDNDADEGYWLPVDAEESNVANWVSNASLTSTIRAMEAKHVLVIADSCYSGKLTRGATPQIRSPEYFTRMSSKRARTALTSGGLEPVLDSGGTDGHSVFASALFRALNENERVVDMSQLFSVIRRKVALDADQVPEYGDIRRAGHDGGDFVFVRQR